MRVAQGSSAPHTCTISPLDGAFCIDSCTYFMRTLCDLLPQHEDVLAHEVQHCQDGHEQSRTSPAQAADQRLARPRRSFCAPRHATSANGSAPVVGNPFLPHALRRWLWQGPKGRVLMALSCAITATRSSTRVGSPRACQRAWDNQQAQQLRRPTIAWIRVGRTCQTGFCMSGRRRACSPARWQSGCQPCRLARQLPHTQ